MKGRNMGGVSAPAATDVRAVGVSTLHGFARAPRINAWNYGKLRGGVRGAVNATEHLPDDLAALRALFALLRPGGTLLLYVPACPRAFGSLDQALGHHRRYTRASLQRVLVQAGLVASRPRYKNRLGLVGQARRPPDVD